MNLPTASLEAAVAEFVQDRDVLDIGSINHAFQPKLSRRGWTFEYLQAAAREVRGVDIEAAEVAKAQAAGYPIVEGNAETYRSDRRHDVVTALDIIEHLSNPGRFLERARENLKPGGLLVLATPNAFSFRELTRVFGGFTNDPRVHPQHVCFFTPRTLKELARRAGFTLKAERYVNVGYRNVTPLKRALLGLNDGVTRLAPRFRQTMVLVFEAPA